MAEPRGVPLSTVPRFDAMRRFVWKLFAFALLLVAMVPTAIWLSLGEGVDVFSRTGALLALGLVLTVVATSLNLVLRWFRWHFLLRRFQVLLPARSSFLIFLAALPAILTPFYVGELLRSLAFLRQNAALKKDGLKVWLIERGADVSILGAFCVWKLFGFALGVASLAAVGVSLGLLLEKIRRARPNGEHLSGPAAWLAFALVGSTAMSWLLPMGALWGALNLLSAEVAFVDASFAFSASTLVGGLTGIPGGVAVSGSTEILLLQSVAEASTVPWVVAVFRLGTVWFAVALGAIVLLLKRSQILAQISAGARVQAHFDDLAGEYEGEIAAHTRDKLLRRKTALISRVLEEHRGPGPLRGLDIGCGQGWYSLALMQQGHQMSGIDVSAGQVAQAQRMVAAAGFEFDCRVGSASSLPYPNDTFDFAYSINVLHHVLDEEVRASCYREIVRVLKPGGVWMLHEMNTLNPLFQLYMSYVFPLINRIDEGNERWIVPTALPRISGAWWDHDVDYFTFLPDFLPETLARWLRPLERWLEAGNVTARYGAHFMATLHKDDPSVGGNEAGQA